MSKVVITATWDDCPHLSDEDKQELWDSIPPYQRDARSKGIPQLGSGAIYPVPESEIQCQPFDIPPYWPRVYGLDVGWQRTAAVWGAYDRESDVIYLYSEHYRGQAEPSIHADAIKARGEWIPGVIDPAANGRSQKDGQQLLSNYLDLGLDVVKADNSVEAGIQAKVQRLSSGRLKIFTTLTNWLSEFRLYRRDDQGRVVKENDHLMDACVVGSTRVVTGNGSKPIRELVGKDGYTLSRSGSWCRFIGARKTIEDSPIVKVEFDDGRTVHCTPDHPFLTPDGWIQAEDMQGHMCYDTVTQRNQWSLQWKLSGFPKRFSRSTARDTIFAGVTSSGMVNAFTALSGSMRTACRYLTGITSTMSTGIARTIPRVTWLSWQPADTSPITKLVTTGEPQKVPLKLPGIGTKAKKDANGTASTMSGWLKSFTRIASSSVPTAESLSSGGTMGSQSSAPGLAKRRRVSVLALMMRNVTAWSVAAALWRIATLGVRHARSNAGPRCLRVSEAGRDDVYCLTVPGTSAFAIEGGLVVHNTRYLVMSGLGIASMQPTEEEPEWAAESRNAVGGY